MSPESTDDVATVLDVDGNRVLVVPEKTLRAMATKVLAWLLTVGIAGIVSAALAWARIVSNQDHLAAGQVALMTRFDALAVRAPAPADTTRFALQSLEARLQDLMLNVRELRRDLNKPR